MKSGRIELTQDEINSCAIHALARAMSVEKSFMEHFHRTVTASLDEKAKKAIMEHRPALWAMEAFEAAVRAHEMKGTLTDPQDRAQVQKAYEDAREALSEQIVSF